MKPASKQKRVTLKMTHEQFQVIEKRAERCKVHHTVWMRSILMQVASQVSDDGYIRKIREPDGALT